MWPNKPVLPTCWETRPCNRFNAGGNWLAGLTRVYSVKLASPANLLLTLVTDCNKRLGLSLSLAVGVDQGRHARKLAHFEEVSCKEHNSFKFLAKALTPHEDLNPFMLVSFSLHVALLTAKHIRAR